MRRTQRDGFRVPLSKSLPPRGEESTYFDDARTPAMRAAGSAIKAEGDAKLVVRQVDHIERVVRALYKRAGQPYGESNAGLNRWMDECLEIEPPMEPKASN